MSGKLPMSHGERSEIEQLSRAQQFFLNTEPTKAFSGELSGAERCAKAILIASRYAFQALDEYPDAVRAVGTELISFIQSVREDPTISLDDAAPPLIEVVDKGIVEASWPERPSDFWKNINTARIALCEFSCRLPKSILRRLEIVGPPSRGGSYADIYKVIYEGRAVAVKKFRFHASAGDTDPEMFCQKIHREIALQYGLCHSNICSLIGAIPDEDSKGAYPILPWYGRGKVTEVLKGNKFTREKAFRFLVEISDGLHYLHRAGIAHGDLHPGNILVDDDEHIRLCDFGISKPWDPRLNSGTWRSGAEMYMAPEIVNVEAAMLLSDRIHHTPESDVYSFGVVCWMIFKGNPLGLVKDAPRPPKIPDPRAIPDDLWRVMLKCWEQRPKDRIKTAELGQNLRALTRSLLHIDVPYPKLDYVQRW